MYLYTIYDGSIVGRGAEEPRSLAKIWSACITSQDGTSVPPNTGPCNSSDEISPCHKQMASESGLRWLAFSLAGQYKHLQGTGGEIR